ncbi:MAG: hypothetical protein ORN83_11140, partial [Chthoniobacteraceae bacterium]|nr:hypothetical protein [Chthoniobacteraceae bacterium]
VTLRRENVPCDCSFPVRIFRLSRFRLGVRHPISENLRHCIDYFLRTRRDTLLVERQVLPSVTKDLLRVEVIGTRFTVQKPFVIAHV